MQVHFNEKYMETEKFPRSTFKGKIEGLNATSTALQQVKAVGQLSIHGVTRDVNIPGTLQIEGSTVT
jgi:polyisoprenoid-binding protein YceI